VLVDVLHGIAPEAEPQPQIVGAEHAVEVGDGREVLGRQAAVELVQPLYAVIFFFQVGLHEPHVGGQIVKERAGILPAEHCYAHFGICHGERVDYRHSHGHVTDGRKPYYEYVLFHRFQAFLYNTGFVAGSLYIFICR
jgi:hypothetical protein